MEGSVLGFWGVLFVWLVLPFFFFLEADVRVFLLMYSWFGGRWGVLHASSFSVLWSKEILLLLTVTCVPQSSMGTNCISVNPVSLALFRQFSGISFILNSLTSDYSQNLCGKDLLVVTHCTFHMTCNGEGKGHTSVLQVFWNCSILFIKTVVCN